MDELKQYNPDAESTGHTEIITAHPNQSLTRVSQIYRLYDLQSYHDGKKNHYTGTLYYDCHCIPVFWSKSGGYADLRENVLVRPYQISQNPDEDGRFEISGLSVLARPEHNVSIFRTIPPTWKVPEGSCNQMSWMVERLPTHYQHLINAIFWDDSRLYKFCHAPASIRHHHSVRHGLLTHTVEVSETVLRLCAAEWQHANENLSVAAALLHDAGKAEEYECYAHSRWVMTDRGMLIGHDITIVQWLSAAYAQLASRFPEQEMLALTHLLSAKRGVPDWTGLRQPAMLECSVLSMADRMSNDADLHARLKSPSGGWGKKHWAMRNRVYSLVHHGECLRET